MISLSDMFDDTAHGRIETMLLMYRIKIQTIILALDACLQCNEIERVDARVFSVTIVESFKEGFCLTNKRDENFEEIMDYLGVLFASGIVKGKGHSVDFQAHRDEIITLCGNARDDVKKHFVGGMTRFDEWLEIFVEKYQHIKKYKDKIQLKRDAQKSEMH